MRKMMLYGKKYGGVDPQLEEGDIFRMVISVPEFDFIEKTQELPGNFSGSSQVRPKSVPSPSQVEILRNCMSEKEIGELMVVVGKTNRTRFRNQI